MHLLGHGLGGTLGLLYARLHPHWVMSLTLLSVGANPAVGWHAHYYALRDLLPCDRKAILIQMARMLFGPQKLGQTLAQAKLLAQVLRADPPLYWAPQSVFTRRYYPAADGVSGRARHHCGSQRPAVPSQAQSCLVTPDSSGRMP